MMPKERQFISARRWMGGERGSKGKRTGPVEPVILRQRREVYACCIEVDLLPVFAFGSVKCIY